jgi:hypothetical protein
MKTTNPTWNMKTLGRMANDSELRFDYPIQRASGQWDALQKSLLIHSILGGFPIPPIAIAKADVEGHEGEAEYVIDGKQRTTTVLDYTSGVADADGNYPVTAWSLHEDTPTVTIGKKEIELAGRFFDQLDDDAQADILTSSFLIQRMEDATDEEIEELFGRWNNGTPLTKQQKARGKMGTVNAVIIDALLKHNFIQEKAHFTTLQRRRSDDEAVILQTMMLMSSYDLPSNGFVADNILKFASEMRDQDITDVTNAIKQALDYINGAVEAKMPILKKLHLPTILLTAKKALDEKVAPEVFVAWLDDFSNAISGRTRDKATVKTSYMKYTNAGSVKREKVIGRVNAMTTHFNEFIDTYEPEIKEPEVKKTAEVKEPKAKKETKAKTVKEPKANKEQDLPKEPESKEESKEETVEDIFVGMDEVLA